ncbi:hypothetical protein Rhein_2057 [Rheinheimera sp. A13L]|uniref:DUF4153 domain-containing protein n=1 Tax=Rheinheimera sp. A13L TaxID=506534 RepID=UPI0002125565|nr:DUF4153 domain-containing protein [Rheinheimera sp. A13L]EGM77798.1 hypothetical protein Rhein_2057 [Rheinheimera sp. A13L]
MSGQQQLPRSMMLLLALLQGLSLYLLHQSISFDFWPSTQPEWLFFLYSLVFVAPLTLLLSLEKGQELKLALRLVPFALLVAVLGFYAGLQVTPLEHISYEPLLFGFIFSMLIASFKALLYIQQQASGMPLSYNLLFLYSWRNFLTLGLSLLFTLAVWAVLMLWAALFKVIQIEFFTDLFAKPWFYYPTLNLAFGFGVLIFRNQASVIDTITRIHQALMKFLLVILALVSVLFMLALPFTGLEPLWKTGHGSILILWLQALMLFFVNAVYQADTDSRPYPLWLHRAIYLAIVLLPVYSLIACYGLMLRVEQYGWSVSRCWGLVLWAVLALFSVGYLWGILKKRDLWLKHLSWINVRMGLVLLAVILLVNSPLIDFRKITVQSQMARLEDGRTLLADMDLRYFRHDLAKPGYDALQQLKARYSETDPALVLRINTLYKDWLSNKRVNTSSQQEQQLLTALKLPKDLILPPGLEEALFAWQKYKGWQLSLISQYHLRPIDLNNDGVQEYVLLTYSYDAIHAELFRLNGSVWQRASFALISGADKSKEQPEPQLDTLELKPLAPEWPLLQIADQKFQVQATRD